MLTSTGLIVLGRSAEKPRSRDLNGCKRPLDRLHSNLPSWATESGFAEDDDFAARGTEEMTTGPTGTRRRYPELPRDDSHFCCCSCPDTRPVQCVAALNRREPCCCLSCREIFRRFSTRGQHGFLP